MGICRLRHPPKSSIVSKGMMIFMLILLLAQHVPCSAAAVYLESSRTVSADSTMTTTRPKHLFRRQPKKSLRDTISEETSSSSSSSSSSSFSSSLVCNRWRGGASTMASTSTTRGFSYYSRVALAGGLAGATGTTVLYPMDSAKTLRQSNPAQFSSVRQALWHLIRLPSGSGAGDAHGTWQLPKAYRGWLPAALGAIPSSALYFGAYESCKRALEHRFGSYNEHKESSSSSNHRWWIHGLAAASGNTISSAVFVPKEVLKQQLQYQSTSGNVHEVLWKILRQQGIRGLYTGYSATLMRNIPSAMVRFVLYEELKQRWYNEDGKPRPLQFIPTPVGMFLSGAIAGAVASGAMTPVDVIKTRLATGTCPIGVQNCFRHVLQEGGWRGLYAGAGSRMMWSGAFSAIGFGTFELVKDALGVADPKVESTSSGSNQTTKGGRPRTSEETIQ